MDKKERLKQLLAVVSPMQAAQAVGVDASYVAQLMQDESFAIEVAKMRCEKLLADTARDDRYNKLEDKLLEKLEGLLPLMMKPREILDALTKINAAKRRGSTEAERQQAQVVNNVIVLQLPQVVKTKLALSTNNEVLSVGDRTLSTIDGHKLIKEIKDGKLQTLASAAA